MSNLKIHSHESGSPASQTPATPKPVSFYCAAPHAQSVELIGDFNQGRALPMQRSVDGWWCTRLQLGRGRYQYRYSIDGRPALDPRADQVVRNELNEPMCLVAVN